MFRKVSKVDRESKNFLPLFVLLAFSACSLIKKDQSPAENPATIVEPKSETRQMILFFPKSDLSGVVKMQMKIEDKIKNPNTTMSQIVDGLSKPMDATQYAVFPEKLELYGVFVDKDMMYIDFSSVIQKADFPTIQMEQLALEALLSTIKSNFPTVQQVKFLSEHEDSQVVFGHTYAQQPFNLKDL